VPAETHVVRGPIEYAEVLAVVTAAVAEVLGLGDDARVPVEAELGGMGGGEMAVYDIADLLEEDLGERMVGFHLDDADLAELRTVGELADYVAARLGAEGA